MSETSRHILHLVTEGFPSERRNELKAAPGNGATVEIFMLTEATARQALEKIFAADTVALWGEV
jgi:hypothetical protein